MAAGPAATLGLECAVPGMTADHRQACSLRSMEPTRMPVHSRVLAALLASVWATTAPCAGTAGTASHGTSASASRSAPVSGSMTSPRPALGSAAIIGGGTTVRSSSGMYGGYYGRVPPPDPNRTISEQDCTKPIVPDGGNLRCK